MALLQTVELIARHARQHLELLQPCLIKVSEMEALEQLLAELRPQ